MTAEVTETRYTEAPYSYTYRRRRGKTDWAGAGLGDAFRHHLDYYIRLSAQRTFYRMVKKTQRKIAKLTGADTDAAMKPKVKPQISPFYTNYPAAASAYAAIGLTAYLEFSERIPGGLAQGALAGILKNPRAFGGTVVHPNAYNETLKTIIKWVETRLYLEELSRDPDLATVETYRLFAADRETADFRSIPEIVRAVVLFGDVLPHWDRFSLHPTTRRMLQALSAASAPFFERLPVIEKDEMVPLGARWAVTIMRTLLPFLPPPEATPNLQKRTAGSPATAVGRSKIAASLAPKTPQTEPAPDDPIAPLNGPAPPQLGEGGIPSVRMTEAMNRARNQSKPGSTGPSSPAVKNLLDVFSKAVDAASGQSRAWEDMRSDIVERQLAQGAFAKGPIEGNPADGHEVTVRFDDESTAGGEIFDRAVPLSEDSASVEKLISAAAPITRKLKRNLYPNIAEMPIIRRFSTGGAIDPARLAISDVSSAVFKRYRIREQVDRRGRPLLVIACDGSGSLNHAQMNMLKLLSAAYLESIAKSDIRLLAGLYHSDAVRVGAVGPLVRWIHHPAKTPAIGARDAVRAVANLPEKGTGVQSDALSLAFIMEEAVKISRGGRIYLVLISDTAWNRSFRTQKTGKTEMLSLFSSLKQEIGERLHITLTALGVSGETGFESILDAVITVSRDALSNQEAVAEKIGVYVARCIRERRRFRGDGNAGI